MTREITQLNPPSTIGIIGGGQLGRMVAFEAKRMGYNVAVLDPKQNSPAGQVADRQITAEYSEFKAMKKLAELSDVLTCEIEHVSVDSLNLLELEGYKIYPSSNTLRVIQNKYVQKKLLMNKGINTPAFFKVNSLEEAKELYAHIGNKAILKSCRGGYDGKGNVVINNIAELEQAYYKFSGLEIMMEEFINFQKEVSIIIARNINGIEIYPISENIHMNGILIKSVVPACITKGIEESIQKISKEIIEILDDYGVFCIEFFIDDKGCVLVNEIAPRPHNSGHYSIEGCVCSQFEQLVRVICGMPLGSSKLKSSCVMYNILGSENIEGQYCLSGVDFALGLPDCHLHIYGKAKATHLKKIGHVTALDESMENAEKKAKQALSMLKIESMV